MSHLKTDGIQSSTGAKVEGIALPLGGSVYLIDHILERSTVSSSASKSSQCQRIRNQVMEFGCCFGCTIPQQCEPYIDQVFQSSDSEARNSQSHRQSTHFFTRQ